MSNIPKPLGLSNIWANGGTKIDPGAFKVNIGWVVQLPPYEYQNWVDNRQDQAIAHISQHGIPEWDDATEYQGLLSYTQGRDGLIYKCLQTNTNKDPSNSLNSQYWTLAFETFGSVAAVRTDLNAHVLNYQTLSGVGNVVAARNNLSVYSRAESDTRFASLNGSSAQVFSVGQATQPNHAIRLGQVSSLLTQATEANLGVVRLATIGVTEAGTDDLTAITPLKGNAVYLKKSGNLAGLANIAAARSNLGLGSIATQSIGTFLQAGNNLSDISNVGSARNNLGLTSTAIQPETYFVRSAFNLSDLPNISTARSNLGLTSTAVTPIAQILQAGNNLSELLNKVDARSNLGLADTATIASGNFMFRGNNLGDLTNVQTARNNLGLGNAATKNIFGVAGDLDLTASLSGSGYKQLGGGLKMQWGTYSLGLGGGVRQTVTFPVPFTSFIFYKGVGVDDSAEAQIGTTDVTLNNMSVKKGVTDGYPRTGTWLVIGV